ncbi:MAG: alpha/beta hydrolase [Polyangiaceae bacterium]
MRFLRAQAARFSGDATRVGAIGASAGGQLVALLGATNGRAEFEGDGPARAYSSRVDAVVDIDGLVDFTSGELLTKEEANPGAPTRFLGGPYRERSHIWRRASALAHVHSRSAPTLFLNSSATTPILPGRAEMKERLEHAGVGAELMVLDHTPHTFWLLDPWYPRVLAECRRFLEQRLPKPSN